MPDWPWTHGSWLLGLDLPQRRVWICGQRVHHGLTGVILALAGTVLMAHDWRDRPFWFRRGAGVQPPGSSRVRLPRL
jgi:hypothetical protein